MSRTRWTVLAWIASLSIAVGLCSCLVLPVWRTPSDRSPLTVPSSAELGAGRGTRTPPVSPRHTATRKSRVELPAVAIEHREVNASQTSGNLAEVSIAVDPARPDRVLAAAMDLTAHTIRTMATDDGGQTWIGTSIPVSSDAGYHADPMVAFDTQGRVHLVHIPVRQSHTLGIEVNRSDDGGRTWTSSLRISEQTDDDKTALAVDEDPDSPFSDRVYVAWKLPAGGVFFTFSDDRGVSYTPAQRISGAAISGLDLATSPEGAVYLVANAGAGFPRGILFFRSLDGGLTFEPSRRIVATPDWYTRTPSICTRMALIHASVGVDRSIGAGRGNVYVTWSDYSPRGAGCAGSCDAGAACHADVFVSRSEDGGETWSEPRPVHEGELGTSDQYHQWLGVDPRDGALYVAYKDTRDDPSRSATHVYLNRSRDRAESFEPSLRLSSASSLAGNSFQYGDYQGLAVVGGVVYVAWADFRSSSSASQIYVSRTVLTQGLTLIPDRRSEFGEVPLGTSVSRRIAVVNQGLSDVRLSKVRLRGPDRAEFFLVAGKDSCSEAVLSPGRSCGFRIRIRPTSVGAKSAKAVFDDDDPATDRFRVRLLASVTPEP